MKQQSLTSFDIYFMATELANSLAGNAIKDVTVSSNEACFQAGGANFKFTIIKGLPYIINVSKCLSGQAWLTRINGARINNIRQVSMDRIISFELAIFNKLGKRKDFRLYFEFFKNGNILLTDSQDQILFSFRKIENIGEKYATTPPSGLNILELGRDGEFSEDDIIKLKSLNILGNSEIIYSNPEKITDFIKQTLVNPQPHLLADAAKNIVGFAIYGPPYINDLVGIPQQSFLDALTEYANSLTQERAKKTDYKKQIKKAENKLLAIKQELDNAEDYKNYRIYGELILANLKQLKKGQAECELQSPYGGEGDILAIRLDPSRSPRQNADDYFDRARRLEKSIPIIKKRLAKQKAEIGRLKSLESLTEEHSGSEKEQGEKIIRKQRRIPFRKFDLGSGWIVFAGKSARSNDDLTFGFARKDDIWFHAWQAYGSHLILRPPEKGAIPDKDILARAASLAAYYSKAKKSSKVPVIYTEVRYIRKVKKVPGKVIYTHEKELMVEPQGPEEILK